MSDRTPRRHRKLGLDWSRPAVRRRYHRLWTRQARVKLTPEVLFERALDHARRTRVPWPCDAVLDAWRPGRVPRIPFSKESPR